MRTSVLLPVLVVGLLVLSCYLPWVTIESKGITITGLQTAPTSFGKPGLFHFVWAGLCLILLFINKIWSKRTAVAMAGFNVAWALRNFLIIPACAGGECPTKHIGLYLLFVSSILLFLLPLLPQKETAK